MPATIFKVLLYIISLQPHLLALIVWLLTEAVQLLLLDILLLFPTLLTDELIYLLRHALRDTHTVTVEPVVTQVTTNVKPRRKVEK